MTTNTSSDQQGQGNNPQCPDFSSHYENAADLLAPAWRTNRPDWQTQGMIDAAAEAEYPNCDGH